MNRRKSITLFLSTLAISMCCLTSKAYAASPMLSYISRQEAQDRAYKMTDALWRYVKSLNGNVQSDIKLPDQLKNETNSQQIGIPYAWGGSDGIDTRSTSQWSNFFDAINKGAMAGNINYTGGYKAGTAGIDCSGFVQSVLKIPGEKQSTGTLGKYLTPISIYDLKNMDVLLYSSSHVAFFQSWVYDDYGNIIGANTIEATAGNYDGTGQKVKEYYRSKEEIMSDYIPGRFNGIGSDFIENNSAQPTIESPLYRQSINKNDGKLYIKWGFNDTISGGYQTAYRIRVYSGDINQSNNVSGKLITQISENTSANEKIIAFNNMSGGNYYFILETRNSRGYWSSPIATPFKVVADINSVPSKIEEVVRFGGQDRYETSKLIAENNFGSNLDNVIIASGSDFPDGLVGVTLAKKLNAPLLLLDKSVESEGSTVVLQYILNKLNKNGNIYILGGEGAVSQFYVDYFIKSGYLKNNIIRIGGTNRNETSVKIAENLNLSQGTPIVISNDSAFADALSISPKAGYSQWPVLLTSSSKLSEDVESYIINMKPSVVYIVGGSAAVSESVKNRIKEITGYDDKSIIRLGGKDRYETVEKINSHFYENNLDKVYVASGENFPDSLSGSVVAAIRGKPLVLVSESSYISGARSINDVTGSNKVTINVFGGDKIITNYLISKINNISLKLQ
ncbi:cell wall-binding repeat-containing protein [Clostridium magnum]|uniref:N-acetylmuramoyl-L-alanine amidase LytC n=1 Tax=Clostridium magnum DSM 2767 TaxID=1121326 RepID=A0A161WVA5_9CLOT|nr:cell wall-binding repeat-containing protein [Clostridium magnum]KZL90808.1 N-acetylmuramoyl-L-alanine amidase LytC precursor [Clostridium magnum DSM 2767]SHI11722.1 Putative cell wall-binding domain [Clostridium magnum DSM 2767]